MVDGVSLPILGLILAFPCMLGAVLDLLNNVLLSTAGFSRLQQLSLTDTVWIRILKNLEVMDSEHGAYCEPFVNLCILLLRQFFACLQRIESVTVLTAKNHVLTFIAVARRLVSLLQRHKEHGVKEYREKMLWLYEFLYG